MSLKNALSIKYLFKHLLKDSKIIFYIHFCMILYKNRIKHKYFLQIMPLMYLSFSPISRNVIKLKVQYIYFNHVTVP